MLSRVRVLYFTSSILSVLPYHLGAIFSSCSCLSFSFYHPRVSWVYYMVVFLNYGYSLTDRTGAAQDYRLPLSTPLPPYHDVYIYSRLCVTTCLYRRHF